MPASFLPPHGAVSTRIRCCRSQLPFRSREWAVANEPLTSSFSRRTAGAARSLGWFPERDPGAANFNLSVLADFPRNRLLFLPVTHEAHVASRAFQAR